MSWITDREEDGLLLLTLPASESQYAPLIVPMGCNECPHPLEQDELFRQWQEEQGMVPLVVTQNTWVVRFSKRPATDAAALQLAKEHFLFCQYVLETFDSVGQSTAHSRHDVWVFWRE